MNKKMIALYLTYDDPNADDIKLEKDNTMIISVSDYKEYLENVYGLPNITEGIEDIEDASNYDEFKIFSIETKDRVGNKINIVIDRHYQEYGEITKNNYITIKSDLAIMLVNRLVDNGCCVKYAYCITDLLTKLCKKTLDKFLHGTKKD